MQKTIDIMGEREVDVRFSLAEGRGAGVVSCHVVEGMSEHVHATVVISAPEHQSFHDSLLGGATLVLTSGGEEVRRWTLQVGGARFLGEAQGSARHAIELHDPLWPLRLGKSTRKFRNLSHRAIVSKVLGEAGISPSWRTTAPSPERNYVVQYRESHLDFVLRLLASEGVYHTIDAGGGVVLADSSPSSPRVPGSSTFELREGAGALHGEEAGIFELRKGRRVATGSVTVDDASWKKPGLSLLSSASAGSDAELSEYVFPAGFREPSEGARLAALRLESRRALADYVEGRSGVAAFAPAHTFTFGDAAGEMFAGDYLLVHVEHTFSNPAYLGQTGELTYRNSFRAIPRSVPFRPPFRPRPVVAGNHTAMVRGPAGAEIHTDAHGRFKAQFHWDREATGTDADSRWIRMVQESATSMFLARVGWEVAVGYVDGDPDRPVGLGRKINGVMIPEYAQPSNRHVTTIKSPSSPASGGYSELRLEDSGGVQRFDLRAERDLHALVKNDQSERIGKDELHLVGASLATSVGLNKVLEIGADAVTHGNENAQTLVQRNRTRTVGAGEKVSVTVDRSEFTAGNESVDIGSYRITIAGSLATPGEVVKTLVPSPKAVATGALKGAATGAAGAGATAGQGTGSAVAAGAAGGAKDGLKGMLPSAGSVVDAFLKGSISRGASGNMKRTIGAAFLSATSRDYSTSAQNVYVETVGAAKLTLAGGSIGHATGKLHVTTVGGAILRTAGEAIARSAEVTTTRVGGMATLSSQKELLVLAPKIQIKAGLGLSVKGDGGALALDMKPTGMEWTGDIKIEAETVKLQGNRLNVTKA